MVNMFSCLCHVRVICSMSTVEMIVSNLKDTRHILKYLLFLSTWSFACSSQRNLFQHFWSLVGTNKKTFLFTRQGRGWVSITDVKLSFWSELTFIPIWWHKLSYPVFIAHSSSCSLLSHWCVIKEPSACCFSFGVLSALKSAWLQQLLLKFLFTI